MKALWLAVLLAGQAAFVGAQSASTLIAEGDRLDAQQKTLPALKVYLEAEKLDAKNAQLHIKIAKQYGESMTDIAKEDDRKKAGDTALSYALRAVDLAPKLSDAHLAVAICYGRLLDLVSVRTEVEYSRKVHDFTSKAIELDPKSDYAWHMLGRWNQAVAGMGVMTRGIVAVVYGGLPKASLETAKDCFEKALKINDKRVSHHIELGRTLASMGKKEEARKRIEAGLALPDRERDDPDTKKRGRETLKDM